MKKFWINRFLPLLRKKKWQAILISILAFILDNTALDGQIVSFIIDTVSSSLVSF